MSAEAEVPSSEASYRLIASVKLPSAALASPCLLSSTSRGVIMRLQPPNVPNEKRIKQPRDRVRFARRHRASDCSIDLISVARHTWVYFFRPRIDPAGDVCHPGKSGGSQKFGRTLTAHPAVTKHENFR